MKKIKVSGPVIIENNKVLLTKDRKDNFWKFPGGGVEPGESTIETCQREAKEEMGIELKIIKELQSVIVDRPRNLNARVILHHYLAERIGKIKSGEEIIKWDWFDIDNLPEGCAPNIKPVIDEYKKSD